MTFKKTLVAASLAALSMAAVAQTNDAGKDEKELASTSDFAATANVMLASSYRFRGIDQTFNQPAIQGGFDITMPYGFYVGNWNSNVNGTSAVLGGGNIEMDVYGGWKYAFTEDWGLDTGLINYFYPGSRMGSIDSSYSTTGDVATYGAKGGNVYNLEYYIGANWKTVSLKQYVALTDYFNNKGVNNASTSGSGYTDLTATYDLGGLHDSLATWGVVGHAGYFYMNKYSQANYADWKLGITKDIGAGWTASASYIQASTNGSCAAGGVQFYCQSKYGTWNSAADGGNPVGTSQNGGHATAVVTIGRTF